MDNRNALQLAFHTVCSAGDNARVLRFLQEQPVVSLEKKIDDKTPLLEACWNGHATTASILVAAGSDVDAKDEEDFSCMHVAALHGFTEILDLLLRHGADIEALDDARSTPFAMAAFNFHESAMRLLANRGANINPLAVDRVSPLSLACITGNDDKVRLLLQLGANPTAQASPGVRGSRNAVFANDRASCLLQVIRYMWESPLPPPAKERATIKATGGGDWGRNLAIAEMLIAAGANLEARCDGNAPVHFAAGIGSRRLMTSLLRAGADPLSLARTANGVAGTALSWAAACSRPVAVRLLLQAGALEIRDERGRSPREAVGTYVPFLAEAPQEEVERRTVAVTHALLRAPAFRARSFLWPAVSGGGGGGAADQKAVVVAVTKKKAVCRAFALRCPSRRGTPFALSGMWRSVLSCCIRSDR